MRIPAAATNANATPIAMPASVATQGSAELSVVSAHGYGFHSVLAKIAAAEPENSASVKREARMDVAESIDRNTGTEQLKRLCGDTAAKASIAETILSTGRSAVLQSECTSADVQQEPTNPAAMKPGPNLPGSNSCGLGVVEPVAPNLDLEQAQPAALEQENPKAIDALKNKVELEAAVTARPTTGKRQHLKAQVQNASGTVAEIAAMERIQLVPNPIRKPNATDGEKLGEAAGAPAKHANSLVTKASVDTPQTTKITSPEVAVVPDAADASNWGVSFMMQEPTSGDVAQSTTLLPAQIQSSSVDVTPKAQAKGAVTIDGAAVATGGDMASASKVSTDGTSVSGPHAPATGSGGQETLRSEGPTQGVALQKTNAAVLGQTTVSPNVTSHGTATPLPVRTSTAERSHSTKSPELSPSTDSESGVKSSPSGINAAKLMQGLGETEMRVGMHSEEFGDISIRTTVSQQQMVTQISLDHNELGQAIATHVLDVQAKLSDDYGLRASIQIHQQGTTLSGGMGGSSQGEAQTFGRRPGGASVAPPLLSESAIVPISVTSFGDRAGLDIRV